MKPDDLPGAPELGKVRRTAPAGYAPAPFADSGPQIPHNDTPVQSVEPVADSNMDSAHPADADDWQEPDKLNRHVEEPGDPDGVIAAEREQHRREQERDRAVQPSRKPKRHRLRRVVFGLLLVIIAAAAVGTYKYVLHRSTPVPAKQQTTSNMKQGEGQPDVAVKTVAYNSDNFTLSFNYPQTWKVTDATNLLSVLSPAVQLTNANGQKVTGHVLLTIQNQQTAVAGYPTAGAVASLESQKLTYDKPTSVQRAQTYLSFLSYSTPDALSALFVTGDNGYQQGQSVPETDIVKGNPLLSISFESCSTNDCSSGATPVTLLASDWQSSPYNTQITALIKSLQLNG